MNTTDYINLINLHRFPCLIWNFGDCPLQEMQSLEEEFATEKNGEIITLTRCYVVLHRKGEASDLIPRNMMELIEEIPVIEGFVISIPCLPEEFDFR